MKKIAYKTIPFFVILSIIAFMGLTANKAFSEKTQNTQYVFSSEKTKVYAFPTHTNELVIDRSQSTTSEVFVVVLKPGQAPPLHKHDDTEQVFYLTQGKGTLTIGKDGEKFAVKVGDVVRIPPSTLHKIEAEGATEMRYIAVDCFVGGRPKAEPTWDDHVKTLCKENGWDYNKVVKNK